MTVAFEQIQRNDCNDLKNARFQVTIIPNNPLVDRSTISGVALWQAIIIDSLLWMIVKGGRSEEEQRNSFATNPGRSCLTSQNTIPQNLTWFDCFTTMPRVRRLQGCECFFDMSNWIVCNCTSHINDSFSHWDTENHDLPGQPQNAEALTQTTHSFTNSWWARFTNQKSHRLSGCPRSLVNATDGLVAMKHSYSVVTAMSGSATSKCPSFLPSEPKVSF